MLYLHKCGHFTPVTWGIYSVKIPKCPNFAQWAARMVFLASILGTEREKTLKNSLPPNCDHFAWFNVVIGLCFSF